LRGKSKIKVYLSGGLGNQLFQAGAARKLVFPEEIILLPNLGEAIKGPGNSPEILDFNLEELAIQIDQREFTSLQIYLAKRILMLSSVAPRNVTKSLLASVLKRIMEWLLGILISEQIQSPRGVGFDNKFQVKPSTTLLIGNFHSYRWVDDTFRGQMRLKRTRSNSYVDLELKAKSEAPVGIHIRLGDYLLIDELNVLNARYYLNALENCKTQLISPTFWIFTNDSTRLGQYLPADLISGAKIVDPNLSSAETLELMRNCQAIITANSTFSWWGAYLRYRIEAPVFTPTRWFRTRSNPTEIIPESWIRIENG
jgi:hypothetical protein